MKRLLWLLPLLILLPMQVEAAVKTLNSYSDAARTVGQDNFATNTVYMKESGLPGGNNYRIIFWDSAGVNAETLDRKGSQINTDAKHVFVPADSPGSWHVAVYDSQAYSPASYSPTDSHIVVQDTSYSGASFTVQASAIPEISDVFTAIWIVFICVPTYWLLKRRVKCHMI